MRDPRKRGAFPISNGMKLLIANWKMNMPDLNGWKNFSAPQNVEVVICPPFPYLDDVRKAVKTKLGGQDVFWENPPTGGGAFTGEISPSILKEKGVEYVLIGHSERRHWLGETDEMINKKVLAALRAGLSVVLCVGESGDVRKKGIEAAKEFVGKQLQMDLKGIENYKLSAKGGSPPEADGPLAHASGGKIDDWKLTIAYEPIWAIGTGKPDKPEDSNEMVRFIKKTLNSKPYNLNPRVLYGGSVTSKNAEEFLDQKEIDGALVGGASLNCKEFQKIIEVCATISQG